MGGPGGALWWTVCWSRLSARSKLREWCPPPGPALDRPRATGRVGPCRPLIVGAARPGGEREAEVSVFGGYNDEAGVSGEISRMILRTLHHSDLTFTLTHLCCADLNTAAAKPIVFGGAVELRSGTVFCAEFSKRTPHMDIRSLRLYSSKSQDSQLGRSLSVDQI